MMCICVMTYLSSPDSLFDVYAAAAATGSAVQTVKTSGRVGIGGVSSATASEMTASESVDIKVSSSAANTSAIISSDSVVGRFEDDYLHLGNAIMQSQEAVLPTTESLRETCRSEEQVSLRGYS